ncbi:MAG: AAA family ATPase [Myxococcales bacterium]|nr:AAA family ATPase [Myxococcales bacterium]
MSRSFAETLRLDLVRKSLGLASAQHFAGGRFEVLGQPQQGAMSRVYQVLDRTLDRVVALKTVARRSPADEVRIRHEFRVRAGLSHPNLLRLHELFVEEDRCFFTMEYLEGARRFSDWVHAPLGATRHDERGDVTTRLDPPGTTSTDDSGSLDPRASAPPRLAARPARVPGLDPAVLARIRSGLRQLLGALQALHDYGKVHRDLKPENVLVTGDRLVLLDFGLAAERTDVGPDLRTAEVAGTVAYMAPEQAHGREVTPAADLYSVGVLLYEALTGQLPFDGGHDEILEAKRTTRPAHPRALAPQLDERLSALAMELLATDPDERGDAVSALVALDAASRRVSRRAPGRSKLFGRAEELAALERGYSEAITRRAVVSVCVEGPSGIGKSALIQTFVKQRDHSGGALVLWGRCSPLERVAFNAWDAVIDSLTRVLTRLPARELDDLFSADFDVFAITRLFPGLRAIPRLELTTAPSAPLDPIALQQRGFAAVRTLFELVGRRYTTVIFLDDVQWADDDSALLLRELLCAHETPLLLVTSVTEADAPSSSPTRFVRLLRELDDEVQVRRRVLQSTPRVLPLGPLSAGDVEQLVDELLPESATERAALMRALVDQSGGNPFVAREFAQHLAALPEVEQERLARVPLDLRRLMQARLHGLSQEQRQIVEVVALATDDLEIGMAISAAGVHRGARHSFGELRDMSLLRWRAGEDDARVTMYHAHLREATLSSLTQARRQECHRGLAQAYEHRRPDEHEALMIHWRGCGEPLRAGRYAILVAERAASALAFERAGRHYELALALLGTSADRPELLERLADTLANRGRGRDAARRYLEAAASLPATGTRDARRRLQRRAAEQHLKSGELGAGWSVMSQVLGDVGVRVPSTHRRALTSAMFRRLRFILRFRSARWLRARPVARDPAARARQDALWAASTSLSITNYSLADDFRTRHLLRALDDDDASARCRALAYEAAMEAFLDHRRLGKNINLLLREVELLAEQTGDAYDRAWLAFARSVIALAAGRWREAQRCGKIAEDIFERQCIGAYWERVTVAAYVNTALAMLGSLGELRERLVESEEDARRRGDVSAMISCHSGETVLSWLAADEGALARDRVDAAQSQLDGAIAWSNEQIQTWQYAELLAVVNTRLYDGDPGGAWRIVEQLWSGLRSAMLLRLELVRAELRFARGRAALALALAPENIRSSVGTPWTRRTLLHDVRAQIRELERDSAPYAAAWACLLRAGLENSRGDVASARAQLRSAITVLERQGMALYQHIAMLALGSTLGADGPRHRAPALAWMRVQHVARPTRLATALAPGFAYADVGPRE